MVQRFPKTNVCFDAYDTERLKKAEETLRAVYNYNYDNSRKCVLLDTIIRKLNKLIFEHGENEGR